MDIAVTTRKPKTPQKENLTGIDGRDLFQTPNYAVDLLVPFLDRVGIRKIWECAAGMGKIVRRLGFHGFEVLGTDLSYDKPFNFLLDGMVFVDKHCIVTNPPFSLKKKFYEMCKSYKLPFALLIPADYSGWIIDAVEKDGAEKIIPSRRVDYVTPDILSRIHEGEIWKLEKKNYPEFKSLKTFKVHKEITWEGLLERHENYCWYESIYDAPADLLRRYSSSQFHSMWLTRGFGIGKSETFVELSNETKNDI